MKTDAFIYATSLPVTLSQVGRHLNICLPWVHRVMKDWCCKELPGGRYDLVDIWIRMWGVYQVPIAFVSEMEHPLLSIEDISEMAGVKPVTIRRAGNTRSPRWNLPEHVDLGPRVRRYLPMHIEAWLRGEAPEGWMQRHHGPAGPLNLRVRKLSEEGGGGSMMK